MRQALFGKSAMVSASDFNALREMLSVFEARGLEQESQALLRSAVALEARSALNRISEQFEAR